MRETARAFDGMVVTPHRLASEAAVTILRQGGNAAEAAVSAAACLSVVYPHMTGIGGDGFWLLLEGGAKKPVYIDACGRSGARVSRDFFLEQGLGAVPKRGALAAITVAGAVSGWEQAIGVASAWKQDFTHGIKEKLSVLDLLSDAIRYAEEGFPVSASQCAMTKDFLHELAHQPGFSHQYLVEGAVPQEGFRQRLPLLGKTLRRLAREGLDTYYRGTLAEDIAQDLSSVGSPLLLEDLNAHRAEVKEALSIPFLGGTLFNSPAPTQGVASLIILALLERYVKKYGILPEDTASFTHAIIEGTKQAFLLRDRHVTDPEHMTTDPASLLAESFLDRLLEVLDPERACTWPHKGAIGGDTIWLGVIDKQGNAVSYIQSIYHEFGSGVALPRTGIIWQNRGLGFSFSPESPNKLAPKKKPFHTLNPALALFPDGKVITYGTMGGEGQPQTQAAVLSRLLMQGYSPQEAISAPRWLLGRTWGDASDNVKMENDFCQDAIRVLREKQHDIVTVPSYSSLMGHAGIIVRHSDGLLEGGFDPRSDGMVGCL